MEINLLEQLEQLKKIPELESQAHWYQSLLEELGHHPWEKFIFRLYLDFNIALPALSDYSLKKLIVGMTLLASKHKLIEGNSPGTYRIFIQNIGPFEETNDVRAFVFHLFVKLVSLYYEANKNGEIEKLETRFEKRIWKWNSLPMIVEERVFSLMKEQIQEVSQEVGISKEDIPRALYNYNGRMNDMYLRSAKRFFKKAEDLLKNNENASFFRFLVGEVKNGGEHLSSGYDIFPHFSGFKRN